jgi:hypothetical protein
LLMRPFGFIAPDIPHILGCDAMGVARAGVQMPVLCRLASLSSEF